MLIIKQSHEENSKLVLQFEGRSAFSLDCEKPYKFSFGVAPVELDVFKDKKSFILHQARQKFPITKEKKILNN